MGKESITYISKANIPVVPIYKCTLIAPMSPPFDIIAIIKDILILKIENIY